MISLSPRTLRLGDWMHAAVLAAGIAVALSGCGVEGRLVISLDRPTDTRLDPLADGRLAKLSLRLTQDATSTEQDAFLAGGTTLAVGDVPVGVPFDLRLAGKTITEEILGVGMVQEVMVEGDAETAVAVKFRKPVGYAAGSGRVHALSTTTELTEEVDLYAEGVAGAVDLAAAANGVFVLVAADRALVPIRTADHAALAPTVLPEAASSVDITTDGQRALVGHAAAQKISIVELDQLGSGNERVLTLAVEGSPGAVAFGGPDRQTGWVLLNAAAPEASCPAAKSQLVEVLVQEGRTGRQVTLEHAVSSLGLSPVDDALLLTLPCDRGGAVGRLDENTLEVVSEGHGAARLAIVDRSLFLASPVAGAGQGEIVRFDFQAGGVPTLASRVSFRLPSLTATVGGASGDAGSLVWVSPPRDLIVRDLAVAPDGQRGLISYTGRNTSQIAFLQCDYEADVEVSGLLLVDLATGEALRFRLTQMAFERCYSNCLVDGDPSRPFTDPAVCQEAFRRTLQEQGLLLDEAFIPSSVEILFGG